MLTLAAVLKKYENSTNFCASLQGKVPLLMNFLSSPGLCIRKCTAVVFKRIASKAIGLIEDIEVLNKLYQIIMQEISQDKSEVACIHSAILSNFCSHFQPEMETNFFSDKLEYTFESLLAFAYNTKNEPQNNDFTQNGINGFATLMSLIPIIPKDQTKFISKIIEKFYQLIKDTFDASSEVYKRKEEFQEYLFLGLEVTVSSELASISGELIAGLVELTLETFNNRKEVFDEGFMLLSSLCARAKQEFDVFVPEIGPFIFHSLNNKSSCKYSVSLISNLCRLAESEKIIEGF